MEHDSETEVTEKNTTGAKNLSKWTMFFASLWIAILTVLKGMKIIDLSINEIIISGGFMCIMWSPTYLSIFLDKIKEIKLGV